MTGATRHPLARRGTVAYLLLALGGCVSAPTPPAPPAPPPPGAAPTAPPAPAPVASSRPAATRYRCDHDETFSVEYGDDSATLAVAGHEREVLPRDAGGMTPQQTVYSSDRLRAEFGLGPSGDQAVLHFAEPPLVLHCSRR